jgi:hypothetical protein
MNARVATRLVLVVSLCLLAAIGCGRKTPPVARPVTAKTGVGVSGPMIAAPVQPLDPVGTFRGRTAEQWGEQLAARDPVVRQEAAVALRELGTAAAPQLVQAMKSPTPEVRLQAVETLAVPVVTENPKITLPVLLLLLQDPVPAIREQAAIRLAWFDRTTRDQKLQTGFEAAQRLQALERVAQTDPHPNVRTAAANSVLCIRSALSGKVASD